jgi:hypothetical protein
MTAFGGANDIFGNIHTAPTELNMTAFGGVKDTTNEITNRINMTAFGEANDIFGIA